MRLNGFLTVALFTGLACAAGGAPAHGATSQQAAAPASTNSAATQKPSPAPADRKSPAAADQKAPASPAVNADAAVLVDFKARVDQYLEVRKQAAKDAPALKETEDPAKIVAAQEAQAARIRQLRASAKAGDLLTPQVRTHFRRLLYPETKGEDGRDARAILKEDAPAAVPLKVNAKYPEGAPLPTVPATFLLNLPTLPKPLEYRIINKDLILLDADANIIVDFAPNVIR